jgi:hypothetical protein
MNRVAEPFVHLLLFECQQCSAPVPVAITSEKKSVEETDARQIEVHCDKCGWSASLLGTGAKRHWVDTWKPDASDEAS